MYKRQATHHAATYHAVTYCAAACHAKVLKSGGNVLLLDEPTNDLDVNTMRSLEEVRCSTAMQSTPSPIPDQ